MAKKERERVNALHRASAISTVEGLLMIAAKKSVSMPCIGRQPFLQNGKCINCKICASVNALHRASAISTWHF